MNGEQRIPVSWWIFFADETPAQACAAELDQTEFLTLLEHRPDVQHRAEKWLLRAARPFASGTFAEERRFVCAAVSRYGGIYEGWDSGWLFDLESLVQFQLETS